MEQLFSCMIASSSLRIGTLHIYVQIAGVGRYWRRPIIQQQTLSRILLKRAFMIMTAAKFVLHARIALAQVFQCHMYTGKSVLCGKGIHLSFFRYLSNELAGMNVKLCVCVHPWLHAE